SSTRDVAQTFAVTCAMLGVPFRLSGLRSLRIKETDRIDALYRELLKVGVVLETEGDEAISWDGVRRPVSEIPAFDTYSDHRMALSLAPVAVFIPGIIINDAEVVTKSYPGYWDDLRKAGFNIEECSESAE
ncbi:MAG: 3-phosphoshikimate 1-carboxyvinyltransferase, partial [Paramuribaculum sp.]|nr:3-phosphoshikimate 1-carboxyvinyltransferase [Paramuribaculum sp.]